MDEAERLVQAAVADARGAERRRRLVVAIQLGPGYESPLDEPTLDEEARFGWESRRREEHED